MPNARGNAVRLSPDARREQILKVAALLFARKRSHAPSVDEIARKAGVTRALVYHYFPGKDGMLEAVLRRESDKVLAATAPNPALSTWQNLHRSLDVYLQHFSASSGALRDLHERPPGSPPLLDELAKGHHAVQVERILTLVGLPDTAANRLVIRAWLGFVVEAARDLMATPHLERDEVIRLCVRVLSTATGKRLNMPRPGRSGSTG